MINDDNLVDISDFNMLKTAFGHILGEPQYDARADFDGNSFVDIQDFNLLRGNFGVTGASP